MIKLANLLPKSLYECVVARVSIDGSTMLAKNRDRAYAPELEVIHDRKYKEWPQSEKTLNLWGKAILRS